MYFVSLIYANEISASTLTNYSALGNHYGELITKLGLEVKCSVTVRYRNTL